MRVTWRDTGEREQVRETEMAWRTEVKSTAWLEADPVTINYILLKEEK